MDEAAMFTPEEAYTFLEQTLGVENPRERRTTDRRRLLDDVTTGLQLQMPYTNIHMMAVDVQERHRPSLEEIKALMLSGEGGVCYNFNATLYHLYKALGFDVTFATATFNTANHLVTLVRNVTRPGDLFLVDGGCGYPTFRAVSLDFAVESPVFRDSFLEYKYIRRDGKIHRMHGKGDNKNRDNMPRDTVVFWDGWRRVYQVDLNHTTNNLDDYNDVFHKAFTDPAVTPYLQTVRCIGYVGRRAAYVSNQKMLTENEEGILETSEIEDGDEGIVQKMRQYYPTVPEVKVRRALVNWRAGRTESGIWEGLERMGTQGGSAEKVGE